MILIQEVMEEEAHLVAVTLILWVEVEVQAVVDFPDIIRSKCRPHCQKTTICR